LTDTDITRVVVWFQRIIVRSNILLDFLYKTHKAQAFSCIVF